MYSAWYDSPVGTLLLTCTDSGLTGVYWNRELPEQQDDHPVLAAAKQWLDRYFRGEAPETDFPLCPEGTAFRRQVWQLLLQIPWGECRSYGSLAREMAALTGKERMSAQAIGQAVGSNPLSIIIPCHRVVGAKGQLTGYAGGIDKKIWLLDHERRQSMIKLEE